MSPRRPIRAWLGQTAPVDPAELMGPQGLTTAVLCGADDDATDPAGGEAPDPAGGERASDAAFWAAVLTPERLARIDSVVAARLSTVTLVLDRLIDPHNTAAILRTSEGMGLTCVHVVPNDEADAGPHRRVTQDAHKWLDVAEHASGAEAVRALQAEGFRVFAGHVGEGARLLSDLPVDRPIALVLGNEHEGPRPETLAASDGMFRIPMAGFTQSFNVSVAAAIALAQVVSARRTALGAAGDLPPRARAALRERFVLLAAKLSRRVRAPRPGTPPGDRTP